MNIKFVTPSLILSQHGKKKREGGGKKRGGKEKRNKYFFSLVCTLSEITEREENYFIRCHMN